MSNITISERAAAQIRKILTDEGSDANLRIYVLGGGCSGFQYSFSIDDNTMDDDIVLERDGVKVLVDPMSVEYMSGSEVDWVDDLIGSSFQIKNPNATASCGCGTSFAV